MIKCKVPKGSANIIANSIRQISLTQMKTLRPVAVAVGNNSNVVFAGDGVLEDMMQVCSNLCELSYARKTERELVEFRMIFDGVLKSSDLQNSDFNAIGSEKELIHGIGGGIEIVVYFRYSCGAKTKEDNVYFLKKNGIAVDSLVVLNSRHSDVLNFSYTIGELDDCWDLIDFKVEGSGVLDENQILSESCGILLRILGDMVKEF